jgi:hypothetical protein
VLFAENLWAPAVSARHQRATNACVVCCRRFQSGAHPKICGKGFSFFLSSFEFTADFFFFSELPPPIR